MSIPHSTVSPARYDKILAYLREHAANKTANQCRKALKTTLHCVYRIAAQNQIQFARPSSSKRPRKLAEKQRPDERDVWAERMLFGPVKYCTRWSRPR